MIHDCNSCQYNNGEVCINHALNRFKPTHEQLEKYFESDAAILNSMTCAVFECDTYGTPINVCLDLYGVRCSGWRVTFEDFCRTTSEADCYEKF